MSGSVGAGGLAGAMSRQTLYNQVLAHLRRATLISPVPNFDTIGSLVMLCEQDLNSRLRAREMICISMTSLTGQFLAVPDDYLDAEDIRIQGGPPFRYQTRDESAMEQSAYNYGFWEPTGVGYLPWPYPDPRKLKYSQVGNTLEFQPHPGPNDQPWTLEMAYFQRLVLGTTNGLADTNSVLNTHPACYVFGSLVAAAPLINDPNRLQQWTGMYGSAIDGANNERQRAKTAMSKLNAKIARL